MGFSSSLQGPASHEALLARQDAEIRLLENMKRCLGLRIKADREYAVALNSFALQAAKNMESVPELAGSTVARAWTVFVEESEKVVRHVKEGAEQMAAATMERLGALYAEKKANRKQYHEEYARVAAELGRLQEAVAKTRQDYDRCLENFLAAKAKLEQLQQHSNGAAGGGGGAAQPSSRRLEEARERYHKCCRKLHLTHNEYVLLLCEASEFERDMRTILLPGLLEHQQAIQEDMVDKWKIILQEVQRCCNTADKKSQDVQAKIDQGVSAIRSSSEYQAFIEQNKTAPPPPVHFKFEPHLVGHTQLATDAVVLDDLTVDTLRQRQQENAARLSECRSQIKDKQTLIIQYETELATVRFKSDPGSVARMFAVKKVTDVLKKEVNELRCVEQKLARQNELIGAPLEELGCEQAPPGCDFGQAASAADEPSRQQRLRGTSGQVMNLLKKPLKGVGNKMFGSAQSLASSSKNDLTQEFEVSEAAVPAAPGIPPPPIPAPSPQQHEDSPPRQQQQQHAPPPPPPPQRPLLEQPMQQFEMATEEANRMFSAPEPPPPPRPPSQQFHHASQQQQQQQAQQPSPASTMRFEPGRPLEEELWFHGVLPRGEVVRLLEMDGDFLVRETVRNDEKQIVLSVMWTSPKHFIVQSSPEGLFRFEGPAFATVQQLIIHQFQSGNSVTSRSGAVLKTPILREKWELNNDDVELLEKIGRGNFGDVYRANLSDARKNYPVAVKTCKVTLPDEQKKKFLQEGRILKQYDHPNIVRFIGICVQKQPIMIVMELVPGGSLLNFLRNHGGNLTQKNLLGMCLDASAGMQYLESKNCIHRDLAARNCLVGEGNVVKISDFGMSREEEEYTVSDGLKQIPIKWTAPEALNYGKYTSLCDVWSYGVLSWEIFSRGGTPYQGMTNTRAREMLDSGYRMPAPDGIPDEMYELMLRCWNYEPEDRPHFSEIHGAVDLLYSRASVGPETRV